MADPEFSFQLKMTVKGRGGPQSFWRRYWQRVLLTLTVALIWAAAAVTVRLFLAG